MTNHKILLDTDIGGDIDDAICLAYLLREPRCELLGVTTVCGQAPVRAAVADAICRAAGADVPIVAGASLPMQAIPLEPTPGGAGALARWPHRDYQPGDAAAFLYEKISANPGEVTLVAIGNMTNVAALFTRYPDASSLLRGLHMILGYFGAAPLPEPWWNWNAWADPLAAKIVLAAWVPVLRVYALEITERLTRPAAQARELLRGGMPLLRAVQDFGSNWLESAGKLTLHDPLAAACVFREDICAFERGFVTIETEDVATMAATRFTPVADGNIELARSVDVEKFYAVLDGTLHCGEEANKHEQE
jgi:purine nucleosidase